MCFFNLSETYVEWLQGRIYDVSVKSSCLYTKASVTYSITRDLKTMFMISWFGLKNQA